MLPTIITIAVWRVQDVNCRSLGLVFRVQCWDVGMGDLVEGGVAVLPHHGWMRCGGNQNVGSRSVGCVFNRSNIGAA